MESEQESPPARKRRGLYSYAIVSSDIWNNPKVCKAGPLGAFVFVFALTRNAQHGRLGVFPASEFEPWYLSRVLGLSGTDAELARAACLSANLVAEAEEQIHIVGWSEEWKRADLTAAESERKRAYRLKISTDAKIRIPEKKTEEKEEKREEERKRDMSQNVRDMSGTKTRGKGKAASYTEPELASVAVVLGKLGARNGVQYQASKEHTRLIVARLRDGYTEMDLRKIIGYCATELEWATKDNMRAYLRPETLFGPETIARYIDPARSWFDKLPSDGDGQKRAGATIHRLPLPASPVPEKVAPSERQAAQDELQRAMASLFPGAPVSEEESDAS